MHFPKDQSMWAERIHFEKSAEWDSLFSMIGGGSGAVLLQFHFVTAYITQDWPKPAPESE